MNWSNSRSIGQGYGFYVPIAMGIIAFMIVLYIVISIIYWTQWSFYWSTVLWWVNILPIFAIGFFIATLACVLKGEDDRKTNDRGMALHQVCSQINKTILNNSDVKVKVGEYSAWLEISYDPSKSNSCKHSPN